MTVPDLTEAIIGMMHEVRVGQCTWGKMRRRGISEAMNIEKLVLRPYYSITPAKSSDIG